MQCDYDVDWLMPYNEESGEVDDVEFALLPGIDLEMVWEWLINAWKERYCMKINEGV